MLSTYIHTSFQSWCFHNFDWLVLLIDNKVQEEVAKKLSQLEFKVLLIMEQQDWNDERKKNELWA